MIDRLDFSVLDFIQEHIRCTFLDYVMPQITKFGDMGLFWLVLGAFLVMFPRSRKCGISIVMAIAGGFVICNLLLKNLIQRSRPCWVEPLSDMLIAVPSDYSFPSGHSMASFAAAAVILHYNKRAGVAAMILAVLIALSRMYLYVHFPTDVICGSFIGALMGFLTVKCSDKYICTGEQDI